MRRTTIGMALLAMSAWLVTGSASGTHLTTEQCQNQHVTILGDDQPSTGVEFLNGTSGSDVILANGGGLDIVDGKDGEDYLYPADWFVALEVPKAVQASLREAS